MNIAAILIWESTNALLLIAIVIGVVMLTRWMRGRRAFTERDWLFLFGHPREKVLSLHLWLRFAALWVAVVLIGFVEGYVTLALRSRSISECRLSHGPCSLACCTEVVTLSGCSAVI
jgi:ABC-type Fe3+ transport system permease subunit